MKIVHVFKDYYPPTRGGVEQHLHDLVHSLDGFDHEVLTAARAPRELVDDDGGVRVVRAAEYGRISTSPVTPGWMSAFRDSSADAFHFHMPNPFGELAFLLARTRRPLVATYHADIVGRDYLRPGFVPIRAAFLRRARRIVVTSPPMLDSSALARRRERVTVIPFGLDAERWQERPAAADEIRARHPGAIVLFLGRLVGYKGVDVLIRAMRDVPATLLVVGGGPKRTAMEDLAEGLDGGARVVFVGEVDDSDRAAYYHAADVFCLPSVTRAEAFGIAALEALACGTPAVTTELGTGTSFVNVTEETGVVVPPRSAAALAGALRFLLADDGRRRRMGEAGSSRARALFTRNRMLDALADVYSSLSR